MPSPQLKKIEEAGDIVEQNNALLKEIYRSTEKTRRYVLFGRVMSFIYLLLILIPLIWGYIVFAPHLSSVLATYSQLFGGEQGVQQQNITDVVQNLTPEQIELLQEYIGK